MHLVAVVLGGPRTEGAATARSLGAEALRAGHRVTVFLAGDGTAHAEVLSPLREAGARVVLCSADAAVRGWDRPGTPGRGSFKDLGDAALDAEAVLIL
jgi:sulfur relay (sulfurtransferase) complex TusBCD TusD component (DsrE family)